ncbi:MAG TPA: VOC family protein [Roseiflexaceae bacterium]|nr:VOC family protein [Roseiflexaceae bacterium]
MSLHHAPLLYVFFETSNLEHQRMFCERVLGLPVIENQFHPPHEYHGLVKYDGGRLILSLNLSSERKFQQDASDGMVTVLDVDRAAVLERLRAHGYQPPDGPDGLLTDTYGHHYLLREAPAAGGPAVQELRLTVADLAASVEFYSRVLGLELLERGNGQARLATGTVDLLLQAGALAPDGKTIRHDKYLIVFYAADIAATHAELIQRGLVFKATRVGYSDIGGTARFADPSGHVLCIYEPSEESLTWGSGAKVREIAASSAKERMPC